jgi:hypothetical protein
MWKSLVLAAALAGAGTACNRVTYVNPNSTPSGVVVSTTGHFFIGGLVGNEDIWANQMCPNGVARVVSEFTFIDSLLTFFTFYLYTPRTYNIECGR